MKQMILFSSLALMLCGCPCADINKEVRELQGVHATYRSMTVPKPNMTAENLAKLKKVEQGIEDSFKKLDELTE